MDNLLSHQVAIDDAKDKDTHVFWPALFLDPAHEEFLQQFNVIAARDGMKRAMFYFRSTFDEKHYRVTVEEIDG